MAITEIPPFLGLCPLDGYEIECNHDYDVHHLISKGMVRGGSKDLRRAIDQVELLVYVCTNHNREKYADHRIARAILVRFNEQFYGCERMEVIIDGLPWKVQPHEFTYKAILVNLP